MASTLAGVLAKLARAHEHYDAAGREFTSHLETCQHIVTLEVDEKLRKARIRYRIEPEPSLRLSVLIGDFVHNAHSALDNLICAIARTANPSDDCAGRQFPIFTDPTKYAQKRDDVMHGVPDDAKKIIDTFQPYAGVNLTTSPLHPIDFLRYLSNRDKHRAVNLTAAYSTRTRIVVEDLVAGVWHTLEVPRPLDPHTEIIFTGVPETLKSGMQAQARGAATMVFSDPGPLKHLPVDDVLASALEFIEQIVVPRLKPFLD